MGARSLWVGLGALFVLGSLPALALDPDLVAAEPWIGAPFTAPPADVAAAAAEISAQNSTPGDTLILWHEERWSFDADGRRVREERRVYRVLGTAATSRPLQAVWHPAYQDRPEIHARVIGPGGMERVLNSDDLREVAAGAEHILQGALPGLEIGSVVEEEIAGEISSR